MTTMGPSLEQLLRRLEECPPDCLAEPLVGEAGAVNVAAVVSDLFAELGGARLTAATAGPFIPRTVFERNRLRLVLLAAWLLHDPWFCERRTLAPAARAFLTDVLPELAGLVDARKFAADPDRREELARLCLRALELRPAGETEAQAQDRLTTISSVERKRILTDTEAARKRAEAVRDAMRQKAAAEAAAKYTRE